MPLAYYSRSASRDFWTEHWGGESLEAGLRAAESSPLTDLILANVPAGAHALEAGCGLGQYVVLLRRTARRAIGVDWSERPLAACRALVPGTPLAAMDLRHLAFRTGAFDAYVSLGVVEHDPDGPDAILREARRVLRPGGALVLSVPYVNLARRLGSWWIRRKHRRLQAAGGEFYQFALTRREVAALLDRHGFRVQRATPYDPARLLRTAWRRLSRTRGVGRVAPAATGDGAARRRGASRDGTPGVDARDALAPPRPPGVARTLAKRLLYTRPVLHAFGHMILFAAVRR